MTKLITKTQIVCAQGKPYSITTTWSPIVCLTNGGDLGISPKMTFPKQAGEKYLIRTEAQIEVYGRTISQTVVVRLGLVRKGKDGALTVLTEMSVNVDVSLYLNTVQSITIDLPTIFYTTLGQDVLHGYASVNYTVPDGGDIQVSEMNISADYNYDVKPPMSGLNKRARMKRCWEKLLASISKRGNKRRGKGNSA